MKTALFVPFRELCGVNDYTRRLAKAFPVPLDLVHDRRELEKGKWDLVHVQYEPGLFRSGRSTFFPQIMASIQGKKIVTAHEVHESNPYVRPRPVGILRGAWWDWTHGLERRETGFEDNGYFADRIIVHTRAAQGILEGKDVSVSKISVLPIPVAETPAGDRARGRERLGLRGGKVCLVFGFLSVANDYELLLETARSLPEGVTMVVAGGPRLEADRSVREWLKREVNARGLGERVRMTGFVEEEALPDLFAAVDLYLSVARVKSGSAALAHALGARLPAVVPDLPCFREVVEEAGCLRLYQPGGRASLAGAIALTLEEEENRRCRESAAEYCRRRSTARFAEEHLNLYRRTLESRD